MTDLSLEIAAPAEVSFYELVRRRAVESPGRIALLAPGRELWTYSRLAAQAAAGIKVLQASGLQPGDRIAIISKNSPEAIAAFLAVSAFGVSAPLNPAHRGPEVAFYLTDLNVKGVIVSGDVSAAVREVASRQQLVVLDMLDMVAAEVLGVPAAMDTPDGFSGSIAMVLHTSGTTALPKIVPLTQRNIHSATRAIVAATQLVPEDRCLNVMPIFHIHGLSAVLASLVSGGSVACPAEFLAPLFFDWIREFQPTWFTAAPTIHQAVFEWALRQPEKPPASSLRFVRSASAPMPPTLIRKIEQVLGVPFIEAYGMTEAAPQIASNPLPPDERRIGSVGQAAGTEVTILDTAGNRLPAGEVGEVAVRGPNIAIGYENNPESTEKQFSGGWFRTEDLGRLDTDGYLYITGRLKEIINRGGEKIAPREVDEVLLSHPSVSQALAFPTPHQTLGEDVAAVVVLRPGEKASERELQDHVAAQLADFKVPRQIVFRDALPEEAGGKLKRANLAQALGLADAAAKSLPVTNSEFSLPRTPEEELIASIWEEVLRVEQIGIHDDFFELGGDSVLAAQALVRGNQALGLDLTFLDFYGSPTIAKLSAAIAEQKESGGPAALPAMAVPTDRELPLSFGQHALWFVDWLQPKNTSYNAYRALSLKGDLDERALRASIQEIVQRHDSLRTTFPASEGTPSRHLSPFLRIQMPLIDLSSTPESEREAKALAMAELEARLPFDLAKGPLIRTHLLRISRQHHLLMITMHHIIMDGWSIGILFRELEVLYEAFSLGRSSPLPDLKLRHADYAYWQRECLQGGFLDDRREFWKRNLAGAPLSIRLPYDMDRPKTMRYKGAVHRFSFSGELPSRLKALGREENATLFMTLLAAFKTLLAYYSESEDIIVGTPIASRDRIEWESIIGYFSNTLVMRTPFNGGPTFREIISRVRSTVLEAHAHHEIPFANVVTAAGAPRVPNQTPLFQVNFRLRNTTPPDPVFPGITAQSVDIHNGMAKFELAYEFWQSNEQLVGFTEYSTELFHPSTVIGITQTFEHLLEILIASPDRELHEVFDNLSQAQ